MTILVVGHPSDDLQRVLLSMHSRGWLVEMTSPGEATARAAILCPHAILVDQGSRSALDAFEIGRRAREKSGVPVVVTTTLTMPAIAQVARKAGCIGISKPCRTGLIIAGLTSAVAMVGGQAWRELGKHSAKRPASAGRGRNS